MSWDPVRGAVAQVTRALDHPREWLAERNPEVWWGGGVTPAGVEGGVTVAERRSAAQAMGSRARVEWGPARGGARPERKADGAHVMPSSSSDSSRPAPVPMRSNRPMPGVAGVLRNKSLEREDGGRCRFSDVQGAVRPCSRLSARWLSVGGIEGRGAAGAISTRVAGFAAVRVAVLETWGALPG